MLYFPVLLVARVSWVVQSVFFVFGDLPGAQLWATKGAELDRVSTKGSLASTLEVRAAASNQGTQQITFRCAGTITE